MFHQCRLAHESSALGVQPCRQPVDHHFADVLLDAGGVLVIGGEHVQVGDEEIAIVVILHACPLFQRAHQVADVPRPRGAVPGEDAAFLGRGGLGCLGGGLRSLCCNLAFCCCHSLPPSSTKTF